MDNQNHCMSIKQARLIEKSGCFRRYRVQDSLNSGTIAVGGGGGR